MERLTTDTPETNTETLLNYAYIKDSCVWLRYAGGENDIELHDYIAKNCQAKADAEEILDGACFECDPDCNWAVLNFVAVQAAELRGKLQKYEDIGTVKEFADYRRKREAGLIVELPCNPDAEVYVVCACCDIVMHYDNDYEHGTGAIECPFEGQCVHEDCDDDLRMVLVKSYINGVHINEEGGLTFGVHGVRGYHCDFDSGDIGKTVFLTREAAEAALQKKGAEQ